MTNLLLTAFTPEIFLSCSLLLQLLYNTWNLKLAKNNYLLVGNEIFLQFYFILLIVFSLLLNVNIEGCFFNFLFISDLASIYIKLIFIFTALLLLVFIWQAFIFQNLNFFEFFIIFFFAIFASLLLISCYDFLSTYILLELQALCFYILASSKRNSTFSVEAGLKYFIAGSFFSCIFLFGILLLYIQFGTTNFYFLSLLSYGGEHNNVLVILGFFLVIVTLFFKLAIIPFHFWLPDVYAGSPLSATIIFAVLSKIIVFTLLIRILFVNVSILKNLEFVFYISGIFSVFWGTFSALKQKRLKNLLIYSSIAQVGFVVLALIYFSLTSIFSTLFFLLVYNLTSVLGWGILTTVFGFNQVISFLKKKEDFPVFLSEFSNLVKTNKTWSLSFLVFLFSLAGIPPFLGFLAKFYLFVAINNSNFFTATVFFILLTSISTFYYVRILKLIFFESKFNKNLSSLFYGNFLGVYKDISITIICFTIVILVISFFYPTNLILICKLITIGFFKP